MQPGRASPANLPEHIGHRFQVRRRALLECRLPSDGYWYALEAGAGALFIHGPDQSSIFLSIVGPGAVLAPNLQDELSLAGMSVSIKALSALTIRKVSGAQWADMALARPELGFNALGQVSGLLEVAVFMHQSMRRTLERVRFALCSYAASVGEQSPCGGRSIRVSRTDLAAFLGVSYDRATRLVRQLHADGEVRIQGRIIVVNPPLLAKVHSTLPLWNHTSSAPVPV